jgi:hypothetical protein
MIHHEGHEEHEEGRPGQREVVDYRIPFVTFVLFVVNAPDRTHVSQQRGPV